MTQSNRLTLVSPHEVEQIRKDSGSIFSTLVLIRKGLAVNHKTYVNKMGIEP